MQKIAKSNEATTLSHWPIEKKYVEI